MRFSISKKKIFSIGRKSSEKVLQFNSASDILCRIGEFSSMSDKATLSAAYIPFKTLLTALNYLREHGVPNVIDKTVFPTMSGVVQSQTISALRFLNLINDTGIPSDRLKELVANEDMQPGLIAAVLEGAYPDLFAGNLAGMSPSQFDNIFTAETYGVTGDTLTKAKTFFLKAAEYAKVPLSSHLTRRSRKSSTRKKRVAVPKGKEHNSGGQSSTATTTNTGQNTSGQTTTGEHKTTVNLSNGGSLTLSLTVNILELRGNDRKFVFDLIDKIEAYEKGGETSHDKEVSV